MSTPPTTPEPSIRLCPACWQTRDSFGHVTWPNGRGADVCIDCLDSMWHRGDENKREVIESVPSNLDLLKEQVMAELREEVLALVREEVKPSDD